MEKGGYKCHQVAGPYVVCCEDRDLQGVHQARLSRSEAVYWIVVETVESEDLGSNPSSATVPGAYCYTTTTLKPISYYCYLLFLGTDQAQLDLSVTDWGWSHLKGLLTHVPGSSAGCRLGPQLASAADTPPIHDLPHGQSFLIAWLLSSKGDWPRRRSGESCSSFYNLESEVTYIISAVFYSLGSHL